MERDFLGLNSKEPLVVAKEEVNTDGYKEIGFAKGSGMQWPFFGKVSALPHLMSFKVVQEDKSKSVDPMVSSRFMPISAADKSFNNERQPGTHLSLSEYPLQHDMHSGRRPHDAKMFPATNNSISISLSNPFFKNQYATTSQNMAMKPQVLGGFPVTSPQAVPSTIASVAGTTDSCSKGSATPAQLTIFYAGTVNVFEDITPEKAQAIMFLAGNGVPISSNMAQPKVQALAPNLKPIAVDVTPVNPHMTTLSCSRLSSPLSVSSHTGAQSGSGSTSTEEIVAARTMGVTTPPVSRLEPPSMTTALGSVSATTLIPSVPQARKASLARFLEKRKERVMNAAPYNFNKKSSELVATSSNN